MIEGQADWVREAEQRRDVGMARAERGEGPDWPERGMRLVRLFAQTVGPGGTFLVEQLNWWAGSERPRNGKAWGPIIQRAARLGVITHAGYAPASTSNRSPKCLWRVC